MLIGDINLPNFKDLSESMSSGVRQVFLNIDSAVYRGFSKVFGLFFDISGVRFLSGDFYSVVFKRVFLILSIFMLFKLTISFISYLISPDTINDPKNPKNLSKLIGRVVVALVLLVVLVPIGNDTKFAQNSNGTYDSSSYKTATGVLTLEENIQNQGILFGVLQSVQDALLREDKNVLGQLILGSAAAGVDYSSIGDNVMMTTFSAFYYVNEAALDTSDGKKDAAGNTIGICSYEGYDNPVNVAYVAPDFDQVKKLADVKCEGSKKSLMTYDVFLSTIVGIIITVLVFLFTFDVALRAIKLGILRLIAPIPAISYISPKSAQDGAFANYTKTLLSTYVDIFVRVAIIYFIILLLSNVASDQSEIINYNNATGPFARVIIIITLLLFAVQAPQFIMQALGIKSTGKGLGFGAGLLGGALAGGIAGATAGGLSGALKGVFGGAGAGASNYAQAASGQRPNMSARQAAMNRGAQLGSGDPNAKGEGILNNALGRIGNSMMGINRRNIETGDDSMKNKMYQWQSKAHTAQSDFTNNPSNLMAGTAKGEGVGPMHAWKANANESWVSYADRLSNGVTSAQSRVSAAQHAMERARVSGNTDDWDAAYTEYQSAQQDLVDVQTAQSQASAAYSDYVRIGAAKAESTYKKATARYQRHGRKDDGLHMRGASSVRGQRNS